MLLPKLMLALDHAPTKAHASTRPCSYQTMLSPKLMLVPDYAPTRPCSYQIMLSPKLMLVPDYAPTRPCSYQTMLSPKLMLLPDHALTKAHALTRPCSYLVMDQENSSLTDSELFLVLSSCSTRRALDGGLMAQVVEDTPGNDTRAKSVIKYSLVNTGNTCKEEWLT